MGFGDMEERQTSKDGELSLAAKVESLLFVADAPVSVGRLAEALETTPGQIEQALADLEGVTTGGGLRLQRAGNRVQLITAPEAALCIERFLGLEARTRLSRAALETLAIIAYRQPMTRPEIEVIRGVNSDSVLRTLLSVGLIEDVGRAPTVGRPILYGTTFEFLQHFGLRSMDELPPLDRAEGKEGVSSLSEESGSLAAKEGAPSLSEEGGSNEEA
jgi:segregation and condensation protein B